MRRMLLVWMSAILCCLPALCDDYSRQIEQARSRIREAQQEISRLKSELASLGEDGYKERALQGGTRAGDIERAIFAQQDIIDNQNRIIEQLKRQQADSEKEKQLERKLKEKVAARNKVAAQNNERKRRNQQIQARNRARAEAEAQQREEEARIREQERAEAERMRKAKIEADKNRYYAQSAGRAAKWQAHYDYHANGAGYERMVDGLRKAEQRTASKLKSLNNKSLSRPDLKGMMKGNNKESKRYTCSDELMYNDF